MEWVDIEKAMSSQAQLLLIDGLQHGNNEALTRVIEEHWESCCRFAYALTGDRGLAEDIVQESFLKLVKNARSYDRSRPLRPWLYKIIENTKREHFRSEMRRKNRENIAAQRELVAEYLPAEKKEEKQLARDHMARLDEPFRLVLSLRFFDQLSIKDIARSLNCPENTVSTRIHRGLHALQKSLRPVMPLSIGALISLLPSLAEASFQVPIAADLLQRAKQSPRVSEAPKPWARLQRSWFALFIVVGLALTTFFMLPEETQESIESSCRALVTNEQDDDEQSSVLALKKKHLPDAGQTPPELENGLDELTIHEFRGRLMTDDGLPVSGILVNARLDSTELFTVTTKSDGRFHWSAKASRSIPLPMKKGGSESQFILSIQNGAQLWSYDLGLQALNNGVLDLGTTTVKRLSFAILKLSVVSEFGNVPGAQVRLKLLEPDGRLGQEPIYQGKTNADGVFRAFFPRESRGSRISVTIGAKGFALAHRFLRFGNLDHAESFVLEEAYAAYGHVLSPEGEGVKDVLINISMEGVHGVIAQRRTDERGRFHLAIFQKGQKYSLNFIPSKTSSLLNHQWQIEGSQFDARVTLKRGGSVQFEDVIYPEGVPAGNRLFACLFSLDSKTNKQDDFVLIKQWPHKFSKVPPGRYRLALRPIDSLAPGSSKIFEVDSGTSVSVVAEFKAGRKVKGRLIDKSGLAVAGAVIANSEKTLFARSDESGRFVLTNCPQDAFQLRIDQGSTDSIVKIDLPPGSETLVLKDHAILRGKALKSQLKGVLPDD